MPPRCDATRRMDQQMNMLGHDDPCPQVQKMPLAGERDGVDHPLPRAVAVEERPTLETGEGEVVGMAGDIVPPAGLSDGWIGWKWRVHADIQTLCHENCKVECAVFLDIVKMTGAMPPA